MSKKEILLDRLQALPDLMPLVYKEIENELAEIMKEELFDLATSLSLEDSCFMNEICCAYGQENIKYIMKT